MKIERVDINNYRGKNFHFAPEKVNLMFAPNGSGKTTLQDAIKYGLTGQTPAKDDPKEMSVEMDLGNGLVIERGKNKTTSCKVNGSRVTEAALNSAIENATGIKIQDFKVTSGSDVLMEMKSDDLLGFLLQYVGEDLDYEKIMGYFPERNAATDEIMEAVFPPMPQTFKIKAVDEAYTLLYDDRKALKQKLAQKKALRDSIKATEPQRDLKAVEDDLAEMTVLEKNAETVAKRHKEWEETKKKKEDLEKKIEVLKTKRAEVEGQAPTEQQLETIKETNRKYTDAKVQCSAVLNTAKKNVDYYEKALLDLEKPICPLSEKLVCTTDKTAVKEEMQELLEENRKLAETASEKIKTADEMLAKCESNLKTWDEMNKKHRLFLQYDSQIKAYEETMPEVPEEPARADIPADMAQKKAALQAEKKNIEDYEMLFKLEEEISSLTAKVKLYDVTVTALGDKGEIKSGIIQYYADIFNDTIKDRADRVAPGYEVKFVADSGMKIYAKTPASGAFHPLQTLSTGETVLISALILDMLNSLTLSRILFIDNLESLDKNALGAMRDLIEALAEDDAYDHIFVSGVDHSEVTNAFKDVNALRL